MIKLVALKYGESYLAEDKVFLGGDPRKKVPISFTVYLIEDGERRILVDAGCETMPSFEMRHFCSPVEILNRYGLDAADITDLIITHAHHDHIAATERFPNATVYIQQEEYLRGKRYIPSHFRVQCFAEGTTVGEHVRVTCIGGHSVGSCVVSFDRDGKEYVICGDECYAPRCLTEGIPTGASRCPQKSLDFVNRYCGDPYRPLLCHDPDILPGRNGFFVME